MVLKKSKSRINTILNVLRGFCHKTTMHGFSHIVKPNVNITEKLFWIATIIFSTCCAVQLGLIQLNRYNTNPTVVSLRKDFREWTSTFPAITICPDVKMDLDRAKEYIEKKWNSTENDENFERYKEFVQLSTSTIFRSTVRRFWNYENEPSFEGINLMELVTFILPKNVIKTNFHTKNFKANWETVLTEMGVCKTFNSIFSKYQSIKLWRNINLGESNKFHINSERDLLTCNYMNRNCFAKFTIINTSGNYYVHSPYEIAEEISNPVENLDEGQELHIKFKTTYMEAGGDVRSLKVSQRRCIYHDEPISSTIPAYSYALCQVKCRSQLAIELCGCKPYFYIIGNGKNCDVNGMACIARNTKLLINLPENLAKCNCIPQCKEINYMTHSQKITLWNASDLSIFDKKSTATFSLLMPKMMMHKDIFFSFTDLIASFGGMGALFLGFSFISAMEIVSLFFKLLFAIRNKIKV